MSGVNAIETEVEDGELAVNLDQPVQKELLFDLADLGLPLDNVEGISFGPKLADGRQSIVLVSDNNFSGTQFTQFLAFAIDLEDIPTIEAVAETPAETRFADLARPVEGPDPDDAAIWLNPCDPDESVVVTSHKDGGLRVYDLAGRELQSIEPKDIRYNNVDVLYNVELGHHKSADLFVASDRANDTLAIYAIDPDTLKLKDVTSVKMPDSIFGVDDGEATAYGLDAFTAADGTPYVFVTQAGGDKIAQLKLVEAGGKVSAELVQTLTLPNPEGLAPEELQSEGIVIDDTTGFGYVSVESGGIWRFSTDPASAPDFVEFVASDADFLTPDLEGLSIRYADDGSRQLFVSSQGISPSPSSISTAAPSSAASPSPTAPASMAWKNPTNSTSSRARSAAPSRMACSSSMTDRASRRTSSPTPMAAKSRISTRTSSSWTLQMLWKPSAFPPMGAGTIHGIPPCLTSCNSSLSQTERPPHIADGGRAQAVS